MYSGTSTKGLFVAGEGLGFEPGAEVAITARSRMLRLPRGRRALFWNFLVGRAGMW